MEPRPGPERLGRTRRHKESLSCQWLGRLIIEDVMNKRIIDVEITPKEEVLVRLGASPAGFRAALHTALTRLREKSTKELPRAFEIPICIAGKEEPLGEVAVIRVKLAME